MQLPLNSYNCSIVPELILNLANIKLVFNLGHSPLYRHFYKFLYIEFDTFPRHDIA